MAENDNAAELIPKRIHYCWFGGKPLSRMAEKCMQSWKKHCRDYDIVRWDETNCDVHENEYVYEAYINKKWAFVSDYFRLKALRTDGGIYLDTDVELLRPLDEFLRLKGFMGFEDNEHIATCVIGGVKELDFFRKAFELYENRRFVLPDGGFDTKTNVELLTELLADNGMKKDGTRQNVLEMELFPSEYFSPKSLTTGKITLTENTFAIHRFEASWQTNRQRIHTKIAQMIGEENTKRVKKVIGRK